jgi:23S rRNA (adenine2503-C2)-methyltransferase
MGMGEPLRNYDAVVRSVRLLMAKQGLNIGQRRITVSTVGEVEGIRRFAREDWQVRLSISLHAANDALRDRLVPINRKYPLAMLLAAIDEYLAATGRQVTFEYTLLRGVNDSLDDAADLAALALPRKAAVNLIPYNPVAGTEFAPPSPRHCEAFRDRVARSGVATTLRKERGQDIDAACGQLRRRQLAGG